MQVPAPVSAEQLQFLQELEYRQGKWLRPIRLWGPLKVSDRIPHALYSGDMGLPVGTPFQSESIVGGVFPSEPEWGSGVQRGCVFFHAGKAADWGGENGKRLAAQ